MINIISNLKKYVGKLFKKTGEELVRKALIIGINDYDEINPLNWCENDAVGMQQALSRNSDGSPNFDVQLLTTNSPQGVKGKLTKQMVQSLFSGEADVALFYFAGHGAFNEDMSEGVLCLQDYSHDDDNGFIRISDILNYANNSAIKNKIIILDSCNSGAAGEDRTRADNISVIGNGVVILTACTKKQYATESTADEHGLFTALLLEGLNGASSNILGQVSPGSLYSFIDNALNVWKQRPVFKTNVSTFISLRQNHPLVDLSTLRKLPEWFTYPGEIFKLDPSFEPDRKSVADELKNLPVDPTNAAIFKELQNCNRHGLIVPHEAEHMFFAAMNSTGCKLTALGEYYRKICINGKI